MQMAYVTATRCVVQRTSPRADRSNLQKAVPWQRQQGLLRSQGEGRRAWTGWEAGAAGKPELLGIRRTRGAACGKAQRHEATALLLASGELGLLSRVGWKEGREGNARVGPQEVAELVCLFLFFMSEFQGGRERFREVTPVQIVLPSL